MVNFVEPALLIKLKGMLPGPRDLLRRATPAQHSAPYIIVQSLALLHWGVQSYEQRCPEQKRERM